MNKAWAWLCWFAAMAIWIAIHAAIVVCNGGVARA